MKWKPEPEVVFAAILAKNPNSRFFWGQYLGCYGPCEADIWGRILRFGSKYSGKISRSQLKGIIHCQVRDFAILGIYDILGGLQPPTLALGPMSLQHYIQRDTVYVRGKLGFSCPFSFGDMKAQILHFIQWQRPHRSCRLWNFPSPNAKIVAAIMRYFDVLWRDKSIPNVFW